MNKAPVTIDKYTIEALVAEGGMGAVYKGRHPTLDRPVILKKLTLRGSPAFAERFRREARILMDFRHDNIVYVHDHFKTGASHYIVMEYVDGMSLMDLISRERYLDNATAAFILLETARALRYAHGKNVVHRDIKPANILISKQGEVKLVDFGIASSREEGEEGLTTEGMTLGTPSYMAPEQFESTRTVDKRADIYSLGVMLYEMLSGRKPYPGGFSPELVLAIRRGRYKHPRAFNPGIAPVLSSILGGLLQPNIRRRAQDLSQIIPRLERYLARYDRRKVADRLAAMVRGEALTPLVPRRRHSWPRRLVLPGMGGLVLALLVGVGLAHRLPLRLFAKDSWGGMVFQVDLTQVPGDPALVELSTSIFTDDGESIPEYPETPVYGGLVAAGESRQRQAAMVLPAGRYRAKTVIDGQIWWNSFVVLPWELAEADQTLRLAVPAAAPRPVRVIRQTRDALDGRDLGRSSQTLVQVRGQYIPLEEAGDLLSGRIQRFRIVSPGYISQDFSLSLKPWEEVCTLSAELLPQAATLNLQLPGADARVLIDGRSLLALVPGGTYRLGDTRQTPGPWALTPGRHQLTVEYQGRIGELELQLEAGSSRTLRVQVQGEALEIR